jgi:hypothetical protein
MDVVTNMCLDKADQALPEAQVVSSIISLLLPKEIDQQPATAGGGAETMGIDLHLNPSIKSTLFQLLLNYTQVDIESHLNEIFQQSAEYLSAKYKTKDLINLKLMYINSIEDSLHMKFEEAKNFNASLCEKLIDCLKELNELMTISTNNSSVQDGLSEINKLNIIAKVRFCLVSFAKNVFNIENQENSSSSSNQLSAQFVDILADFLDKNAECKWFRYFLIKNIFKRYGQSEFQKLTQNESFAWIFPEEMTKSKEVNIIYFIF